MLRKRIKYLMVLVAIIVTLPNLVEAQTTISSPYSRYGIGNTNLFDNAINNAMGGVGYAYKRNNSVNYMNPASYAGVDTTSLVFDIGFYTEWVTLSSDKYKSTGNNTNLSHILMAFPIGSKFKVALGLIPMSSVNFTTTKDSVSPEVGKYEETYAADGGLNKALLGFAYSPIKNLSIGINLEYIFGNYYKSSTTSFPDSSYMFSSRVENNYHVKAFNINFGVQYFHPLSNGDNIGIGIVYNPPIKYPTDNILSRYTFTTSAGLEYLQDSVLDETTTDKIKYPSSMGLGLSYERPNKFFVGIDGKYVSWSNFLFQSDYPNTNLVNNLKLAVGGEWKPNAYGNYFQKSIYRLGFSYDDGMLELYNTRIKQIGISCGIGLPIKKSNTMVNLSFEYLKRGTIDNSLIKEDYFRVGLSFSAKDLWFFKRKYQ
ncbi:MAG: hypothetical protein WC679_11450 [Bacteroidales bacterium]|jgi:hypothetical protein